MISSLAAIVGSPMHLEGVIVACAIEVAITCLRVCVDGGVRDVTE